MVVIRNLMCFHRNSNARCLCSTTEMVVSNCIQLPLPNGLLARFVAIQ